MSVLDVRLLFQKECGYGLDSVNHMAINGDREYVTWLEEKVEQLINKTSKNGNKNRFI
jgi:hypothetical protein